MDPINSVIANNLKRVRKQRKLSLDALAKLSGVSKSMLGQIERGEVNPTISTVWKITNGLKITFSELMDHTEAEFEVIKINDVEPLTEDQGRYRNYPLFTFEQDRRVEFYYIELDPKSVLEAEPHPEGTKELIMVFSGTLFLRVDQETMLIPEGCAVRFKADREHRYENSSDELCRISMVISYNAGSAAF